MSRSLRSSPIAFLVGSVIASAVQAHAADPPAEYRRPELVAIAWQSTDDRDVQPAWRPDGTMLDQDETKWLQRDLGRFSFNPVDLEKWNHPLMLIFKIDERAKSPQFLTVYYRKDGRPVLSGGSDSSGKNFLTMASLRPRKVEMREWGPEVDFEVRVPIGEIEVVKKVEPVPAGEIHVDKGVRWYVELRGEPRQPTAVLEVKRTEAEPLSDYFVEVRLKNGELLRERFRKFAGDLPLLDELKVSDAISEKNPVLSVEFRRLRHRMERYEKIPTHLELKPK